MAPLPDPFKKATAEPLRAVVGADPCAGLAGEDTAYTRAFAAPAPGTEDPSTTGRQWEALERWRALAGEGARALVSRTAGGVETVFDADGSQVGDAVGEAGLLMAIKGTRPFREASAHVRAEAKAAALEAARADEGRREALASIAGLAPVPRDAAWYRDSMAEARTWTAEPEPFAEPEPSLEAIAADLGREARRAVNPLAFWRTASMREEYVASRARDRIAKARRAWRDRRDAWEKAQADRVAALDAAREEAVSQLQKAMDGDAGYVVEGVVRRVDELQIPLEVGMEASFSAPNLLVSVDLSGEGGVPDRRLVTLRSGWLRERPVASSERRETGERVGRDLARVVAAVGFDVSPAVERVRVSATLDGETLVCAEYVRSDLAATP